ncbi:MAG: tandem-95 repeat protein [Notoacmeibacter sp.]|nr:tandem-95 repeat protein [Notoacmeibacter sp.]
MSATDAKGAARMELPEALEPRVLLDAAALETALHVRDHAQAHSTPDPDGSAREFGRLLASLSADKGHAVSRVMAWGDSKPAQVPQNADTGHDRPAEPESLVLAPIQDPHDVPVEVFFIDGAVEDIATITASLPAGANIFILDGNSDGVEQMAGILEGFDHVDALHIISHGRSGTLDLGSAKLTEASMAGRHADEMAVIANVLSEDADILIYGCDFAANARGASAVQALADITGADVAASVDLTGAFEQGGDWILESRTGAIEAMAISAAGYRYTLGDQVIDGATLQTAAGAAVSPSFTVSGPDSNQFTMTRDDGGNITGEAGGAGLGREFNDSLLNGTETYTISVAQGVSVIDLEFAYINNNIDGQEELRNFHVFDTNGADITSSVSFSFADNSGPVTPGVGGGPLFFGTSPTNGQSNTIYGGSEAGNAATNGILTITSSTEIGSVTFTRTTTATGQTGTTGAFGVIMTGLDYTTGLPPVDTDGDGVTDDMDIDDDNDGIIDVNEGYIPPTGDPLVDMAILYDGSASVFFADWQDGLYALAASIENPSVIPQDGSVRLSVIQFSTTIDEAIAPVVITSANAASIAAQLRAYADDFSTNKLDTGTNTAAAIDAAVASITSQAIATQQQVITLITDGDADVQSAAVSSALAAQAAGIDTLNVFGIGSVNAANAQALIFPLPDGDTDGFFTPLANYAAFQTAIGSAIGNTVSQAVAPQDTDGDGIPDYLDIDSDNDGITDNIEAQGTVNYIAPSGVGVGITDVDGDGLDDNYDANTADTTGAASLGLTPIDTDGDGTADLIDIDSDNDGLSDTDENGLGVAQVAANAADTDGDGLKDAYELAIDGNANDGFVVNEGETPLPAFATTATGAIYLPDSDNDASLGISLLNDLNFRDSQLSVVVDTDGDGVVDSIDIDDDNDGILDINEGTPTTLTFTLSPTSTTGSAIYEATFGGQTYQVAITAPATHPGLLGPSGTQETNDVSIAANGAIGLRDDASGESVLLFTSNIPISQIQFFNLDGFDNATGNGAKDVIGFDQPGSFVVTNGADLASYDPATGALLVNNPAGNAFTNLSLLNASGAEMVAKGVLSPILFRGTNGTTNNANFKFIADNPFTSIAMMYEDIAVGGTREFVLSNVTIASFEATVVIPSDTDGDGIIDSLDIDSDDDGITDNIEAQATGAYIAPSGVGVAMVDIDGDGLDDNYDANTADMGSAASVGLLPVDTDSDGTADYLDTDSDNDGTADVAESGLGVAQVTPGAVDTDGDGLKDAYELAIDGNANDGYVVSESVTDLAATGSAYLPDTDGDMSLAVPLVHDLNFRDTVVDIDTDGDGVIDLIDIDDDNDGVLDTVETDTVTSASEQIADFTSFTPTPFPPSGPTDAFGALSIGGETVNLTVSGSYLSPNAIRNDAFTTTLTSISSIPGSELLQVDLGGVVTSIVFDFNGAALVDPVLYLFADGSSSVFDIGIPFTIVEGQGTQVGTTIQVNAVSNSPDFVAIRLQGVHTGFTLNDLSGGNTIFLQVTAAQAQLSPSRDTDGDGIVDRLDIDSDDDGITDTIEAQATGAYIAPSGAGAGMTDLNGDGLDDAFGAGLTPVDTDSDGTADYLDADSDNDGLSDNAENGLGVAMVAPGATDADGDGLKDAYELAIDGNANDGFVVSEGVTDPLLAAANNNGYLPDDGDAVAGSIVPMTADLNFRDATPDNQPPVGVDDTISVAEDTPATKNVLTNDTDPDGDPLTISSASMDVNGDGTPDILVLDTPTPITDNLGSPIGTVTVSANGDVSFVPAPGYLGPIPDLVYTPNDGTADGSPATVVFGPITPVNDAPQGTDNSFSLLDNQTHTFTAAEFGFSDPLDSPPDAFMSVIITTLPAGGTLTLNGNPVLAGGEIAVADIPNLVYTPSGIGSDSFTFQVRDDGGTDANLVTNGSLEDFALPSDFVTLAGYTGATPPTAGEVSPPELAGWNRLVQYDGDYFMEEMNLATDANPTLGDTPYGDQFGFFGSVWQTITGLVPGETYTISGDAIVDSQDPFGGSEAIFGLFAYDDADFNGTWDLTGDPWASVLAQGIIQTSVDGDSPNWRNLTFTFVAPASGSIDLVVYKSAVVAAACYWDNIQVTRTGGGVDTDPLPNTIAFTVASGNTPPVSSGGTLAYFEDQPVDFTNAVIDFTDPDAGQSLDAIRIETLPANGTLTIWGAAVVPGEFVNVVELGGLVYSPAANGAQSDSFTYSVHDGFDWSVTPSTMTITGTPANDSPVPVVSLTGDGTVVEAGVGTPTPFALSTGGAPTEISVAALLAQLNITDIEQTQFGIGITFADESHGVWEYLRPDVPGHDWTPFQLNDVGNLDPQPVPVGGVLLMDPDAILRFTPDADFSGTANFGFRVWDMTVGTASNPPSIILDDSGGAPPTATSSLSSTVFLAGTATDYDGDGVADVDDLDDDNDGILDTAEGYAAGASGSVSWFHNDNGGTYMGANVDAGLSAVVASTSNISFGSGFVQPTSSYEHVLSGANSATYAEAVANNDYVEVSFTLAQAATLGSLQQGMVPVAWGGAAAGAYQIGAALSSDGFASSTTLYQGETIGIPTTGYEQTFEAVDMPLQAGVTYTLRFYLYDEQNNASLANGTPLPNGTVTFDDLILNFSTSTATDTDGDGVPDHLDLDSDNDGISDLIESGQDWSVVDTNNDGVHDGPVDANGVPVAANGGVTPVDTDNDGLADVIDLDSDNDLIPDQIEAQPTLGYQSLTNVNNASNFGVNDIALFVPADTDGDGIFDFRDTDSDNDAKSDTLESGLTASGTDADNNGIDDVTGAVYGDGDGILNDPQTALANETGDTSQVGYREVVLVDTDGDGIADDVDIDDDNDGILDANEGYYVGTDPAIDLAILIDGSSSFLFQFQDILNFTADAIEDPSVVPQDGSVRLSVIQFGTISNLEIAPVIITSSNVASVAAAIRNIAHMDTGTMTQLGIDLAVSTLASVATPSNEQQIIVVTDGDPEVPSATTTAVANAQAAGIDSFSVIGYNTAAANTYYQGLVYPQPYNDSNGFYVDVQSAADYSVAINQSVGDAVLSAFVRDTDGDGIADHLDLDSDNDGISDLYESTGGTGVALADTNNDGTISLAESIAAGATGNGDIDGDGLMDIFDANTADTTSAASIGTTAIDTDNDGIQDYLDLDSDGDGIVDTVEARLTAGYVANDGDVTNNDADGDGVIDIFDSNDGTGVFGGTFIAPVNTDTAINNNADATPDYLDTDSDGDGMLDSAESGITLLGVDSNGDGADDATGASYADPDGIVNNPQVALANQVLTTLEVAYREIDTPPIIDLNDNNTTADLGFTASYVTGATAVTISDPNADAIDVTDNITEVVITAGGILNGNDETVTIGGTAFPMATSSTQTVTVGGTSVQIAFDATAGTFTITEAGGGILPQVDLDTLIRGITYQAVLAATAGTRTLSFTATDEGGNTTANAAVATITVTAGNTPPTANPEVLTTDEDVQLAGNVLANDTDPDAGQTLTVTGATVDANGDGTPDILALGTVTPIIDNSGNPIGNLTLNSDGNFTFDPALNYNGPVPQVAYSISDGAGGTASSTLDITVLPVNDAPVAQDDAETINEGDTLTTENVLLDNGNGADNDVDNDALTVTAVNGVPGDIGNQITLPSGALLTLNANGTYAYDPNGVFDTLDLGQTATDSFTYEISDGNGGTDTATVTITIQGTPTPPAIVPDPNGDNSINGSFTNTFTENGAPVSIVDTDAVAIDVDSQIIETAIIVLTNAFPGDVLQVSIPAGTGVAALPAVYDPIAGTITLELFSSTANPADMATAIRSITFSTPSEDPDPTPRELTITLTDDSGTTGAPVSVFVNVVPVNDAPVIDLDRNNSTATGDDYAGTYTENDPGVPIIDIGDNLMVDLDDTNMQSATVTLTNAQPEDLITLASGYTTPAGLTVTITGNVVSITGDMPIADYQAALEAIRFEATGENPTGGTRTFDVVVNDGQDNSNVATAAVTVVPVNDAPIPIDPAGDPTTPADAMPPQTGNDAAALTPFDVKPYFNDVDSPVLTYSLDPATAPSWMSINPVTGVITGTPPADGSQGGLNSDGIYTVTVIASDPAGLTGQTDIQYTISNPPPVAIDDSFGMIENGTPLFQNVFAANPLTQDTDPDGDTFSVTAVAGNTASVGVATAGSTGGLFTIQPNGSMIFTQNGNFDDLADGETRDTTITYTITDADGATDTATVTITVLGTNDAPVVVSGSEIPDQIGLDAQTIAPIDVTTAFNDPDTSDVLTFSATGLPTGLVIDPVTGIISGTIDHSASQNGNTSTPTNGVFTVVVTATDPHGASVTDTFVFTVSNPAPIATDDAVTLTEDDPQLLVNVISDNLGNGVDSDPDGDTPLTVSEVNGDPLLVGTGVTGDNGGTFTISPDGTASFDPGQDFQYLDDGETATTTVTYQITDGEGGFDTATLTVTVTGLNDAPVPVDPLDPAGPADPANYVPDQSGTDGAPLTPFDTSPYFGDPDTSDTLTYSSPDLPVWMSIDPVTGIITGTPPLDASQGGPASDGVYPITITVTDGDLTFSTTLDYTIANLPPDAVDDAYTLTEDQVLSVPAAGILVNDTDGDGDPITVTQINGDPLAVGVATVLPSGATVTLNADGSFDYDPTTAFNDLAAGETGTDSFTYQIGDGDGLFDTATVTFTIIGVNDAPTAVDDAFAHTENGTPITGNVLDPNPATADSDPDATDVLTVTEINGNTAGVGSPVAGDAGGLFTIDTNGDLVFDDNGEFEDLAVGETRDTTVSYTIDDGNGGTDTATVTVTVAGTNDAPIPLDPSDPAGPADPLDYIPAQTGVDGTPVTPIDLTPYFGDPDTSNVLTISVDPADLPVGLAFDPLTNTISGTPGPDASQNGDPLNPGTYVIPVTATDPYGATFTTNIVYTITNQPPVAQDDALTTDEDTATTGSVFADNGSGIDTDAPDGDVITVSQVGGLAGNVGQPVAGSNGGTFTINPDGTYSFEPGTDFNGLAVGEQASTTIGYQISDGQGGFDTALVTVVVTGVNDAPVIIDPIDPGTPENPNPADPASIIPVQAVTDGEDFTTTPLIDIDDYVQDPDQTDDPLLVYTTTDVLPAGLTLNPDGTITGTVDPSASQGGPGGDGIYPVTVSITDPSGATATVGLTIDVSNLDPTAVNDASTGTEDVVQTGNVLTDPVTGDADTPPDSDPVTVTGVDGQPVTSTTPAVLGLTYGSLELAADGSWTFTPNGVANQLDAGETATEVVTYTIDDGQGGTDTATLTINITGINDPVQVVDPLDPTTDPENPSYDPANPTVIPDPLNLIPDVTYNDGDAITPIPAGDYFGDAEGDTITFSASDLPTGLSIDPVTGEITGTIDANASQEGNTATPGEHLVTITATDPFGNTAITTVTITAVNLPVVAEDDAVTGDEDTVFTGSVIVDNGSGADHDTAPDSDPLTVIEINGVPADVGQPVDGTNGGVFTINTDGTFTFEPGNDFQYLAVGETATTTVEYTLTDSDGSTDTAIVTYTVTGVNDAPIPVDPTQPPVLDPMDPNAPPTDPDNPVEPPLDPQDYVPHQPALDGGTVTPLDLTPYFGDSDGSDVVTLSLDSADLPAGLSFDPATGTISGTLDNSASQATNVPGGTPGTYVIPVTATDPSGATFTTNVTYVITNPAPDAQDDALTIDEDTLFTANVFGDNGNGIDQDTPPDTDDIHVSMVDGNPANVSQPVTGTDGGSFIINPDGSLTFNPGYDFQDLDVGESRTTTITYEISDGEGGTDTATVTVTVTGLNDAPVVIDPLNPGDPNNPNPPADPDNIIPDQSGADGTPITPLDVAPYFTDVDGEPLTFGLDPATTPSWIVIDPVTGEITGTPPAYASIGGPGGDGVYTLIVSATDPDGATVTTTVDFTIANLPPVAEDDALTVDEDTVLAGSVLADNGSGADHDTSPDGDPLVVSAVNGVAGDVGLPVAGSNGGTFVLNPDGSYSFDPGFDFQDLDVGETRDTTVTYTIDDGNGGTDTATVTVTVTGVNDAPVVIDPSDPGTPTNPNPGDPATVLQPQQGTDDIPVIPLDLSPYFVDVDGEPLVFDATGLPPGLAIDPLTGIITGTPLNDDSIGGPGGDGIYPVTITVTDPDGATATLTFDWTIVNQPPVVVGQPGDQSVLEGGDYVLDAGSLFDDPDNDTLTFTASGLPVGVSIDPVTGIISGTPEPGSFGNAPNGAGHYVVTVTVDDGQGGTATLTFDLMVEPIPSTGTPNNPGPGPHEAPPVVEFGDHSGLTVRDAALYAGPLGEDAGFDTDHVIEEVVDYIGKTWNREDAGYHPYAGQNLDVAFGLDNERMMLRTMVWQGSIFLEMRSGAGLDVDWTVTGLSSASLPDWMSMAADNLLRIDIPAGTDAFRISVNMRLPDGRIVTLPVSIDRVSGEITPLQPVDVSLADDAPAQDRLAWLSRSRSDANTRLVQALRG